MNEHTPEQSPKQPRFRAPVWLSTVLLVVAIVAGTTALANTYLVRVAHAPSAAVCTKQGTSHLVVIENDQVDVPHVQAKLCDTLTIMNKDIQLRLIAFGPHDQHITYDDVSERLLSQGQSFTVILNQPGTFSFHDHEQESVSGEFTVALH